MSEKNKRETLVIAVEEIIDIINKDLVVSDESKRRHTNNLKNLLDSINLCTESKLTNLCLIMDALDSFSPCFIIRCISSENEKWLVKKNFNKIILILKCASIELNLENPNHQMTQYFSKIKFLEEYVNRE
jgi:hypothetical protein